MKPKEWLLANGHIKEIGRGRLAKDHILLVTEAAKTTFIEGYSSGAPPKATVQVEKPEESEQYGDVVYTYPEEMYRAIEYRDGKRVERGMRCICNNCRRSLVQCTCGNPIIVAHDARGSVSVTIEPK